MSRQSKLISLQDPVNGPTGNHSSGSRTLFRHSVALAVDATGCASQPVASANSTEATLEIALDQLRVNDQVLIRTACGGDSHKYVVKIQLIFGERFFRFKREIAKHAN